MVTGLDMAPGGAQPRDLDELAQLARRAAHEGGAELLRRFGHVEGLGSKSTDTDLVSDADRASEHLIADMLLGARPDDGMLAEEGTSHPSGSGITWVVDPLDGTVNYVYGMPGWAVSIAADDAAGTCAGVVHDPVGGHTYSAVRGGGAYRDGERLAVNDPVPLDRAMLATGFSYRSERRRASGALIAELLPRVRDIRRFGSAAIDLCYVAAGIVDAYLEEDTNHWDRAAGALIAREAGAIVTAATPTGGQQGALTAGPALHAALTSLLGELAKPDARP